jgi:SAM domain (Sterile alpha motif)
VDLGDLLGSLGLEQDEAAFRGNKIGSDILPKLTADDLKDLRRRLVGLLVRGRGNRADVAQPDVAKAEAYFEHARCAPTAGKILGASRRALS